MKPAASNPAAPSQAVVDRLRELEGRLNSLGGTTPGFDTQPLRDAFSGHEERRGKMYSEALRQAGMFAVDLAHDIDLRVGARLIRLMDGAAAVVGEPTQRLGAGSLEEARMEQQLTSQEQLLPGRLTAFSALQESAKALDGKVAAAAERMEAMWRQQDPIGIGGWRLVMRAVSGQVELEKEAVPAFIEQYRGTQIEEAEPVVTGELRCPRCKTQSVRRIQRETMLEEVLRLVFVAPYRCSACGLRSYQFRYQVRKAG